MRKIKYFIPLVRLCVFIVYVYLIEITDNSNYPFIIAVILDLLFQFIFLLKVRKLYQEKRFVAVWLNIKRTYSSSEKYPRRVNWSKMFKVDLLGDFKRLVRVFGVISIVVGLIYYYFDSIGFPVSNFLFVFFYLSIFNFSLRSLGDFIVDEDGTIDPELWNGSNNWYKLKSLKFGTNFISFRKDGEFHSLKIPEQKMIEILEIVYVDEIDCTVTDEVLYRGLLK